MAMKAVDVGTASELLSTHAYLDFAAGHVPGSVNIPVMVTDASGAMVQVPPAAFVASVKAAFPDTSKPMLVGCKSGGRSAHAITLLPEYNDLANVTGGFGAWVAGGLPTEK